MLLEGARGSDMEPLAPVPPGAVVDELEAPVAESAGICVSVTLSVGWTSIFCASIQASWADWSRACAAAKGAATRAAIKSVLLSVFMAVKTFLKIAEALS